MKDEDYEAMHADLIRAEREKFERLKESEKAFAKNASKILSRAMKIDSIKKAVVEDAIRAKRRGDMGADANILKRMYSAGQGTFHDQDGEIIKGTEPRLWDREIDEE